MGSLMQSYYLYSALLAVKLLALVPLSQFLCSEKMQRANLSDLKHLTPFWLVAGLYMTTNPDYKTAITLLRMFVAARLVAALGYVVKIPRQAIEGAFFVSFAVSCFMAAWVINTYKNAL